MEGKSEDYVSHFVAREYEQVSICFPLWEWGLFWGKMETPLGFLFRKSEWRATQSHLEVMTPIASSPFIPLSPYRLTGCDVQSCSAVQHLPHSGFVSVVLFVLIFAVTTRGTRPLFVMGLGGQLVILTSRGMFIYINLNLCLFFVLCLSTERLWKRWVN